MSVKASAWVWDHGPEGAGEMLVLLALADFANDVGECWPAMETIARKVRMSERGVRYVIRKLEASGHILAAKGGGRCASNVYRLSMGNPAMVSQNTLPPKDEKGGNPQHKGGKTLHERGQPVAPKPSGTKNEPEEEVRAAQECAAAPSPKPEPKARLPSDWVLDDAGWEYARAQGIPDNVINDEARGFHVYWSDRSDSQARKSARGWAACWEGWCRRIAPRYARQRPAAADRPANRADPALERIAYLAGLGRA